MNAASLLAELTARGVLLSVAPTPRGGDCPPLRLRVLAPDGALTPALSEAMKQHRDGLLALVFELEERAAIHLERTAPGTKGGATAAEWEAAERFARSCVRGAGALPDEALRELAESHPLVTCARERWPDLQIVEVRRETAA